MEYAGEVHGCAWACVAELLFCSQGACSNLKGDSAVVVLFVLVCKGTGAVLASAAMESSCKDQRGVGKQVNGYTIM